MERSLAESTQQILRPGECVDIYYPDPETAKKACFRTTVNTRYNQQFTNLGAGTSVFTIPPNNGVQDIVLQLTLPDLTVPGSTGLAVPRGWGYALISQISYRYGGSSQYFLTGAQMLQDALRRCPNGSARDALLSLGGNQLIEADLESGKNYAYVWLSLPHTMPSSSGKLPPFASDLLTQQIQITCTLNPLSTIFSQNGEGASPIPAALGAAQFQVQQVLLANQGDALAKRVDMTSNALSYPCEFVQQELVIPCSGAGPQQLTATGFRSGEVRSIQMWLTNDDILDGTATGAKNPLEWFAPEDFQMLYAGEVYARFDGGSSKLWNLVNNRLTPDVNTSVLSFGGGVYSADAEASSWLEAPFGQTYNPETAHTMYVAGMPITNGIVNFNFTIPEVSAIYGEVNPLKWKLHVSYVYNAVAVFSQGSVDLVM